MVNNMIEENNDSTGNGSKSRFSERLKKIQTNKRIKNKINGSSNKYDVRRIFKPFLILSSFLYGVVKNDDKIQNKNNDVSNNNINNNFVGSTKKNIVKNKNNKQLKTGNFNISNVNNEKELLDKCELTPEENKHLTDFKIKELQNEIINLIKKRLVNNMNELEMIRSELYILKELTGNDVYFKECQENVKEVKKLLSKIKTLKEKYDYLKENTNFDNLLEIEDDSLVDKIIELKDLCTNEEIKSTVDNYKILEEYKFLYLKIDKLEENVLNFNKYKLEQEEKLKQRDIDFEKLKYDLYDKKIEQEKYNNFIKNQELLFNKINEKMFEIDSHEVVNYKLKGFNLLLVNSFKYLGLMLASPFKGILPGIVTETLVTKNVIHNLYNNLEWEESRKTIYETIDFSVSIKNAMSDLEGTLNLVNATLDDVKKLKQKYEKDFSKYEYSFSEYSDIMSKMNKMENAVINNKIKIQLMLEKMKVKEKENEEKLKKVKKLNSSMNN